MKPLCFSLHVEQHYRYWQVERTTESSLPGCKQTKNDTNLIVVGSNLELYNFLLIDIYLKIKIYSSNKQMKVC
jgi:hypothetical protein